MSVTPEILWAPPTDYDYSHYVRVCRDDMDYWQCKHVCYDFKLHCAKRRLDNCLQQLNLGFVGNGTAFATKASLITFWTKEVGKAEMALQRLLHLSPSQHWDAWRNDIRHYWRNHLDAPGFQQMWRVSGDMLHSLANA